MKINVYWNEKAENCMKCMHGVEMSYFYCNESGFVCDADVPVEDNDGKNCKSFRDIDDDELNDEE